MAARMIPGQTAEIAGPKKAFVIPKPEVAASLIKRAKRPLLVVGSKAVETPTMDGDLIDTAIRLHNTGRLQVVATAHLIGEFMKRGAEGIHSMQMMNLGDRLRDPDWTGLNGEGAYDLVVFMGTIYYIEWLVESGLKSFASDLRTISLNRYYQPNAHWSLGTMPEGQWREFLDEIVTILEEEN